MPHTTSVHILLRTQHLNRTPYAPLVVEPNTGMKTTPGEQKRQSKYCPDVKSSFQVIGHAIYIRSVKTNVALFGKTSTKGLRAHLQHAQLHEHSPVAVEKFEFRRQYTQVVDALDVVGLKVARQVVATSKRKTTVCI